MPEKRILLGDSAWLSSGEHSGAELPEDLVRRVGFAVLDAQLGISLESRHPKGTLHWSGDTRRSRFDRGHLAGIMAFLETHCDSDVYVEVQQDGPILLESDSAYGPVRIALAPRIEE